MTVACTLTWREVSFVGGKKIRWWSESDIEWLKQTYRVNIRTAQVYRVSDNSEVIPCRVGPGRKQYLAVSARIGGKWTKVRLHCLVWFFATGKQSPKMIDHIKGDPVEQYVNRFENLREATDKQNCANKFAKGYRTYTRRDGSQSFYAVITWTDKVTKKVKTKRSPLFDTPDAARAVYLKWKKQRFGEFVYSGDVEVSAQTSVTV